jgi:hypothetical protein
MRSLRSIPEGDRSHRKPTEGLREQHKANTRRTAGVSIRARLSTGMPFSDLYYCLHDHFVSPNLAENDNVAAVAQNNFGTV